MHPSDIQNLLQQLSNTEKTIELSQYWQNRYIQLLQSGRFAISDKTQQVLTSTDPITKPTTPYGNVYLSKHLDSNNNLDQVALQSTVEIAVRLLDASLDCINFDENSRYQIEQYRKIGIGVEDIQTFLETQADETDIELIDRIGKIVSTAAYRASESLAIEKGIASKWTSIANHIRPKSFENWYNPATREIKTGLEISQEYDSENIMSSGFMIIPRRNSHLLLLPTDIEWQLWSDRDEHAPQTPLDSLPSATPKLNLSAFENPTTPLDQPSTATENDSDITKLVENQIATTNPNHDLAPYSEPETELLITPSDNDQPEQKGMIDIQEPTPINENEGFLQGELVRFKNDQNQYIYQVIRKVDGYNNPSRYQLYGHQIGENELVSETDLEAVNIDDILNFQSSPNSPLNISLVYLSEDGQQVMVTEQNNQYFLPKIVINDPREDLYATISEAFTSLYGQETEVEASTFLDVDGPNNTLYIGVSAHLAQPYQNCHWLDISDLSQLTDTDYRLAELYVAHENYLHELLELNLADAVTSSDSNDNHSHLDPEIVEQEKQKLQQEYEDKLHSLSLQHQQELTTLRQQLQSQYESQVTQLQNQQQIAIEQLTHQQVNQKLEQELEKIDQNNAKDLEAVKKNLVQKELAKLEAGETKFDLSILNHPSIQAEIDKRATQKAASIGDKLAFRASVASLKKITEYNQNS